MKILMIGGTGVISLSITKLLAERGEEVWVLNRGLRCPELPEGVHLIQADISREDEVIDKLGDMRFDTVCEFIGYTAENMARDVRLFSGRTKQYMFISSAATYQKPLSDYLITESTPQANEYSDYAQNKLACEEYLMRAYREHGFPVTIVRPSHTYEERSIPLAVRGNKGGWPIVKRMIEGKPVIIQGDGSSLWTMTHSTDFAKGFVGLVGNIHAIGETFQITSDESLTWNQIYECIARALGVELHPYYVPSDFLAAVSPFGYRAGLLGDKMHSVVFDNSKLKRAVPDFAATVRFDQGVKRSIDYFLAHPELQVEEPEFDAFCDRVIEAMENAKRSLLEA